MPTTTLPKVRIINRVILILEQRELIATASNRLGFLVVVAGSGLCNKKLTARDVLNVMLDPDKRYFTVRTKWGDNCYPYCQFHDAIRWAKQYLGYNDVAEDYQHLENTKNKEECPERPRLKV
jgi:hypothetical protein